MEVMTVTWYAVSERLPESAARVLVLYYSPLSRSADIRVARFAGGAWRFLTRTEKSRLPERVMFWAPMPKMPRRPRVRAGVIVPALYAKQEEQPMLDVAEASGSDEQTNPPGELGELKP